MSLEVATASVEETIAFGARLGAVLEAGDFVVLEGPLGAGKSRFVEGLARGLGVDPARRIPSPTFTLVNEHEGRLLLVHADFYRLESAAELEQLGWRDYLEREAVVAVEWLSRVGVEAAPRDRIEISIQPGGSSDGADARRITVSATGPRAEALLRALVPA